MYYRCSRGVTLYYKCSRGRAVYYRCSRDAAVYYRCSRGVNVYYRCSRGIVFLPYVFQLLSSPVFFFYLVTWEPGDLLWCQRREAGTVLVWWTPHKWIRTVTGLFIALSCVYTLGLCPGLTRLIFRPRQDLNMLRCKISEQHCSGIISLKLALESPDSITAFTCHTFSTSCLKSW